MRARDASIDIVRGVAIILIVVGHVLRGLANASVFPSDAPLFPRVPVRQKQGRSLRSDRGRSWHGCLAGLIHYFLGMA